MFWRVWALSLLLVMGSSAHAGQALQVSSEGAVFGLPGDSASGAFIEKLGPPTAEVKMSAGRRGLMFGNSMLLVFSGDRLVQVRCWLVPEFTSDLFLGWMQEVPGYRKGFKVDGQVRLGLARDEVSPFTAGLEGSGDERSEVVDKAGTTIWLGYGLASEYRLGSDEEQVVNSITVNFPRPVVSLSK